MTDHTRNALTGICNTLTDIVGPGVSAGNPLAQQELRMAVRYLEFLQERVEHLYARARFELCHSCDLATTVRALDPAPEDHMLAEQIARARKLLDSPGVSIGELRACADHLATTLTDLVHRVADQADQSVRRRIERAVVQASAELTSFERSWYLPLGLDHFGHEVQPLDAFLDPTRALPSSSGNNV